MSVALETAILRYQAHVNGSGRPKFLIETFCFKPRESISFSWLFFSTLIFVITLLSSFLEFKEA